LVFLDINGHAFNCKEETVYETIMDMAKGELNKGKLIKYYEKYSRKKPA
jgi:prophage maintenance system killer protein